MALLKLAALGTLGYIGYKYYQHRKSESAPAFAARLPGDLDGTLHRRMVRHFAQRSGPSIFSGRTIRL